MNTYKAFNDVLVGRNAESKKLANNTYAFRCDNGVIVVRLHQTNIVTYFPNGKVVLNSGNWRTVTTKARLNEFSPFNVFQNKGIWSVGFPGVGESVLFQDGLTYFKGKFSNYAKSDNKETKLRKKIRDYSKLVVSKLPLPLPSGQDCWFCGLRTEDGKPLGECSHNTDHLISHIKEKYVVPSLVFNALKSAGCTPQGGGSAWFGFAFDNPNPQDWHKKQISKFTTRYLYKQFGLVV
jgi:hypothetical protein